MHTVPRRRPTPGYCRRYYVLAIHRTGPIRTDPEIRSKTGPDRFGATRTGPLPPNMQKKIRDLEISLLSKFQPPTTLGDRKNAEKAKRKILKNCEISFSLFLIGFRGARQLGTSKPVSLLNFAPDTPIINSARPLGLIL